MDTDSLFPICQESQKQSAVDTQIGNKPMTFSNMMENCSSEFTLAEIIEMEKSFKGLKEASLNPEFCQKLATQFSCSHNRQGQSSVKWDEVHAWFQEKQEQEVAKSTSSIKLFGDLCIFSSTGGPNIKHKTSPIPKVESAVVLKELLFEAKSARDLAWYDVGSFLSYKVTTNGGELLVRVRFAGFDNSNDEWVSVEKEVRERSIPLDDSECHMVEVGDLVLCYRNDEDDDMYFDAHVVRVERNSHHLTACNCVFVVRYDHDGVEENVDLHKLCRRPS
ncbi:hypothetical protein LIER_02855 [Lithospermum erythrorhizon]|uniref:SAWADEE domain-containing protein n=1 Tax=Lithospermum erythrorhizon TaxID=34254 RepID=A0AAV3NRF7_LITER